MWPVLRWDRYFFKGPSTRQQGWPADPSPQESFAKYHFLLWAPCCSCLFALASAPHLLCGSDGGLHSYSVHSIWPFLASVGYTMALRKGGGGSQTANSHQKSSGKMSSSGSLLLVQRGWGNRPFSLICQCLGAPVCHGRVCLAYSNNTATIGATKGFSWGDISWLQQAWPIALTGLPPSGA